jgi:hypothetical protein
LVFNDSGLCTFPPFHILLELPKLLQLRHAGSDLLTANMITCRAGNYWTKWIPTGIRQVDIAYCHIFIAMPLITVRGPEPGTFREVGDLTGYSHKFLVWCVTAVLTATQRSTLSLGHMR